MVCSCVLDVIACSILALVVIWIIYYVNVVCKKPRIFTSNQALRSFLKTHVRELECKFCPNPMLYGGRIQTVLGIVLRDTEPKELPYMRKIIKMHDGGQVALDFLVPVPTKGHYKRSTKESKKRLVVLILPGILTSSQDCFMKTVALAVRKAGGIAVVFNHRGFGGVPLTSPQLYNMAFTYDVQDSVRFIRTEYPNDTLMCIGISIGGIQLCHYLIRYPDEAKQYIDAVLVISVCWDTVSGLAHLQNSMFDRLIDFTIAYNCRQQLKDFQADIEALGARHDFEKIYKTTYIYEFAQQFVVPFFGYENADEYFCDSQVKGLIDKLPIPVIALNAGDDPLQLMKFLPIDEAEQQNSNLALIVTDFGGHVGWVDGILPLPNSVYYLERIVTQITTAVRLGHFPQRKDNNNNQSLLDQYHIHIQ